MLSYITINNFMEGDAKVRRTISVTNIQVINTLNNAANASELVEVAIKYYLGVVDESYVNTYRKLEEAKQYLKGVEHIE